VAFVLLLLAEINQETSSGIEKCVATAQLSLSLTGIFNAKNTLAITRCIVLLAPASTRQVNRIN